MEPPSDRFGDSVSQSGNILAVGAIHADPGGNSNAGAAYIFQLEANGSATYLTKVTAPDGTRIYLEYPFPNRAIFLPSELPSQFNPMPELLIFINWNPMDPPPT